LDRPAIRDGGFRGVALNQERVAQIAVQLCVARLELDRLSKRGDSFIEAASVPKHVAKKVQRIGVAGLGAQDFAAKRLCFLQPSGSVMLKPQGKGLGDGHGVSACGSRPSS
jgi:hypothetical protein